MTTAPRKSYPSDISDEGWALAVSYLALVRELLNGFGYVACTVIPWRAMPHNLPRCEAVYGQAIRGVRAGCFDDFAQDLRAVLRMAGERESVPTATVLDSHILRSTPKSGARTGYDGAKCKRGVKVHLAVDTSVRKAVEQLAQEVQEATGEDVEVAYVDQGYAGQGPVAAVAGHGIRLEVVRLPEAKRGFVLLPQCWVVERSFAWGARCRSLVRDYECPAQTLADMHTVAFSMLLLKRAGDLAQIHNTARGID